MKQFVHVYLIEKELKATRLNVLVEVIRLDMRISTENSDSVLSI